MAEFDTPTELVDAARKMRDAGYRKTDAFSPFPLHEIDEALGIKRSILPYLVFGGGIVGLLTGLALADLRSRDRVSAQCRRSPVCYDSVICSARV